MDEVDRDHADSDSASLPEDASSNEQSHLNSSSDLSADSRTQDKPKRRGLRFSLLSFCIFVFGCGALLGYWQMKLDPIVRQWTAVEGLVKDGATTSTGPQELPSWMTFGLEEGKTSFIEGVDLRDVRLTEDVIKQLQELPRLKTLRFDGFLESEDRIDELHQLVSLENLEIITDTNISMVARVKDRDLKRLIDHPSLQQLTLFDTEATRRTRALFESKSEVELTYTAPVPMPSVAHGHELELLS